MFRRALLTLALAALVAACGKSQGNPFASSQSRIAPAGAVLMFVSSSWANSAGQPHELFATNADGTQVERLTGCAQAAEPCDILQFAVSPDRNRVAVVRSTPNAAPGRSALYFVDLSRSVEKLIFPTKRVGGVDWSVDGSFLVYSAIGDAQTGIEDLFLCAPDGTNDQNLTQTPAVRERSPRIDPYYFSTAVFERIDETGVGRIYLFQTPPRALTSGPAAGPVLPGTPYVVGADADPVFSPDATQVAFRRLAGLGNGGLGAWDLLAMKLDGTELRTLASGPLYRGAPDWGKGGIAFVETDAGGGSSRLVVVQPDGSGRAVVREEAAMYGMASPRWIPGN